MTTPDFTSTPLSALLTHIDAIIRRHALGILKRELALSKRMTNTSSLESPCVVCGHAPQLCVCQPIDMHASDGDL